MTLPLEALLVLAVLGFYLFDSAQLLYSNDVMFVASRRGWQATTGSSLQLRGRQVFVPNAFTPQRGMFRAHWNAQRPDLAIEHIAGLQHFIAALRPLGHVCIVLWMLLLVALPLLLVLDAHPLALLALAALVYGTIAGMVLSLCSFRRALHLERRDIVLLALDAFACPPFAVNMVRKVCLKRDIGEGAITFAARVLPPAALAAFRVEVAARVQVAIDFADDSGPHRDALVALHGSLQEPAA